MAEKLKLTCLDCAQVNAVPAEKLGSGPKCGTCGAALMPEVFTPPKGRRGWVNCITVRLIPTPPELVLCTILSIRRLSVSKM